jgi:hypothetical protein
MCLNKKVIAGLVVAAGAIYLLAPNWFGAALPLLIFAACPLSMLLMMRMMSGSGNSSCNTKPASGSEDADELARLRAEVDGLRAEQGAREHPAPEAPEPR